MPAKKYLIARHFCRLAIIAAAVLGWTGLAAAAVDEQSQSLLAMRAIDERVTAIGHRLAVANLPLCRDRQWLPGFAVHHLAQYGADYRASAIRAFGFGDSAAVLALAAGGPAERAGLRRDDHLLRLDGALLPIPAARSGSEDDHMEPLLDAVDIAFADGVAVAEVRRGSENLSLRIEAERGCASRFQVAPSRRANAYADGRYVKVTTTMAINAADDQELAWILAHEFAHNVLRHRDRLDEADVARGFFGNFGRNARLIRETEAEADRLSVYLLDRAGYDPEGSIRFWNRFSRRGLNFLGSPTHPNWRRRVETFQAEIALIRRARSAGTEPWPAFVPSAAAPES